MTIRDKLWALLRDAPRATPKLVDRHIEDGGDHVVEHLRLDFGEGPVRGVLVRPPRAGRHPAILYAHAHGGRYDIGAAELLEGRAALLSPLGPVLAGEGYVALMIDMPTFGERRHETESALSKALLWRGKTLMGQMLAELAGALGYLAGRDDVDEARIGAFGISMGATHAYMLAALDQRIKAVAHFCCFADIDALIRSGGHDRHGPYFTVPGLAAELPIGVIAGAIAPRPQLICNGEADPLTPPAAIELAHGETAAAYRAAGAAERLRLHVEPGGGHAETPAMREKMLAFFREHL